MAIDVKIVTEEDTTIWKAINAFKEPVEQCQFGDAKFKWIVCSPAYWAQVLHHATVLQVGFVLFVVIASFLPPTSNDSQSYKSSTWNHYIITSVFVMGFQSLLGVVWCHCWF